MTPNIKDALATLAARHEKVPYSGDENILLVDDEPIILENAAEGLRDLGYNVVAVLSAEAAIGEMVKGFMPHILCTDIVLPGGMNGVSLAREIRMVLPRVKVLLMSGYGDASLGTNSTNQDGFQLLCKPYMLNELAAKIRDILDN
jgi:DNA-binding NtrC family response regulator